MNRVELADRKDTQAQEGQEKLRVLLVEDNPGDVTLMEEMLSEARSTLFETTAVPRLRDAQEKLAGGTFDLVLLDLGLPDSYGLATLESVINTPIKAPVVVLTGLTDESLGMEAVRLGAQDYMAKGNFDTNHLERSIRYAVQRKKLMEELKESNDRYVSLFQENHAVMMLLDPVTGTITDVNQAALDFYGYDRKTFTGMELSDIVHLPSDKVYESLGKAVSQDQGHFFFQHKLANGSLRDVEVYSGPLHIQGKTYLYQIVHDVTERKKAETERERLTKEVEQQRELLKTVVDNIPVGIIAVAGTDLRVRWVNMAYLSMSSQSKGSSEFIGSTLDEVLNIEDGKKITDLVRSAIQKGTPITDKETEIVITRGGTTVYWHSAAVPIPIEGDQSGALVMLLDVTEQVVARRRIEDLAARSDAEKRRVKTILDNLPVGVQVADASGRVIEKNDIVDTIWGGRTPTPMGIGDYKEFKAWWADTGMSVRPDEWAIIRAIKKGDVSVGEVIDILRFDGTRGTILSSASPIRDADGKALGAVAVIQDITRQRKLEHDAIEAKEQAELYIDLLSHDISNMNAAISGYLQLALEKMDIEQKNMHYFSKPLEILENSNRLIENVRKIQQVESHESKHGLVDLGWLLEDVRAEYEHYPGRDIKINYKTSIKKFVMASELLKDVFTNLVSNAIKHSTGPLEITMVLTKVFEGGREYYKVVVEDDGPGIPDELKSRLFQRKQRGKTKTTGTGLGLYLVKKLVEDFNGRVWVEDLLPGDPSSGTRFVVLLPAVTTEERSII
jgi:PAS domain S-box-containing protein